MTKFDITIKKPVVTFTNGDYQPIHLASGLIGFRSPVSFNLEPLGHRRLDLRMSADTALFVFSGAMCRVIEAGKTIIADVDNEDTSTILHVTAGDVIARAQPLLPLEFMIA